MKLNAFIHQGAFAALDLGERMSAVPLPLLGLVGAGTVQNFPVNWLNHVECAGVGNKGVARRDSASGQPDPVSQPASAGVPSLDGGFWSLFAVQTPGAPLLTIRLTSPNTAVILWASPATGFTLQQNTGLNPAHWVAALQAVADNGTNKFVIIDPLVGNRFYRLFKTI